MGKTNLINPYQDIIDFANAQSGARFNPFDNRVPLAGASTMSTAPSSGIDIRQSEFQIPSNITPEDLPYYQAAQQDNWSRLGRTLGNLPFNVGFGILETFGYLGSMPDLIWGGDFDNALTSWAREKRNAVAGQVYEPVYGKSTVEHLSNPAWWIVNGGGLAESISEFGITTIPIAGALGKAAQLAANVAKVTARTATGLNLGARVLTGVTTGYMEGAMSGAQIYQQTYEDGLSKGLGIEAAQKNAAEAAATTTRINTVLMGISNAAMLGPAFFSADKVARAERYAQQMGLSQAVGETNEQFIKRLEAASIEDALKNNTYKIFGKYDSGIRRGSLDWLKESTMEAGEEVANVFAEQRGLQAGGVTEKKGILETLSDVLSSPEGQMSALLGAFGGIGEASIISRIPWHRYQETKETTDAEGRPITEPVGAKQWVSAKTLEDKEVQEKFEQFKGTIIRDVKQFEEGQKNLSTLKTRLINAEEDDKEWLKTQIELQTQKLFDFSAYQSLQTGNLKAIRELFQGVAELDNTEVLSDKIDQQIATLKSTRDTLPEDGKAAINIEIERLERESAKYSGMTAAMAAGLADSTSDNAYKTRAENQIEKLNSLEKIYDDTMARYNYGDELTYGLAKYIFSAKAELLNIGVAVEELTKFEQNLAAKIDAQMAADNLPMDLQAYVKNQSAYMSLSNRLNTLLEKHTKIRDNIDSMTESELLSAMHEMGVPTSTLPVDSTKEQLIEALTDYTNTTAAVIGAKMEDASDELLNAITSYANSKAINKPLPLNSTATPTPDLEEAKAQLEAAFKKEQKNLYGLATVRTRLENLKAMQTHLDNSINKLASAKGRKQFIEFVKKQLEDRAKTSAQQKTEVDSKNITERRFANELRMKGYDKDFVNALMKALTEGTALPQQYRNTNVFVQGSRGNFTGKRYRIYIDENGKATISELKPKGKKRSRWELTGSSSVKFTDKKDKQVYRNVKDKKTGKFKKVLDKNTELRGKINVHAFMRSMRVLSVQENNDYNATSKLRVKRTVAKQAAYQMIRQLQDRQANAQAVVAMRTADIEKMQNVQADFVTVFTNLFNTFNLDPTALSSVLSRLNDAFDNYKEEINRIETDNSLDDQAKTSQSIIGATVFEEAIEDLRYDVIEMFYNTISARHQAADTTLSTEDAMDKAAEELEAFTKANASANLLFDTEAHAKNAVILMNRSRTINDLQKELDAAQNDFEHLQQRIEAVTSYLQDLSNLPLTSFNTAPIVELRLAVEGELKDDFPFEFASFMDNTIQTGRQELAIFMLQLYEEVEKMPDTSPEKDQMKTLLNSLSTKYGMTQLDILDARITILADRGKPNLGVVENLTSVRVAKALKTLADKGFKLDTLEDLIKAEEILLMRDLLEQERVNMQAEIDALQEDLNQLREFRNLQVRNLALLAKTAKNASLFDMTVVEDFKGHLESNYKDLNLPNPEEILKALALDDEDSIAYNAMYAALLEYRNGNVTQVQQDIQEFKTRFADRHIDSDTVTELLQDQINALTVAKDEMLRNTIKRQALFVTLMNKYITGLQDESMFKAIYYKKLKDLGSHAESNFINNFDLDFNEDIEPDYYTVARKTSTEFSTTGMEDIFTPNNPAYVDEKGNLVMAKGIRGINKDDGTILNPNDPVDRVIIEKHLPMERWFRFTSSNETRKLIKEGKVNLKLQSIKKALEYAETIINDVNSSESKKLTYGVLKKELEAMIKSIEDANPANSDEILANTVIAIPVTSNGDMTHAAYFDADINATQAAIPWTVLRKSTTVFPRNQMGDTELDLEKLGVGSRRIAAAERNLKFEVAGNTVTIFTDKEKTKKYTFPNGDTSYTIQSATQKQRYTELQQLRRRIAIDMLRAEYETFIKDIVNSDDPQYVEIKATTPGMNLMVHEITPSGPKMLKRKMSEISVTQDTGDFKGKLYIAQRDGLTIDGVQYSQFSPGQLVYKGVNDETYLAMTKNLEDLDPTLRDRFIDVFLYALLLAGTVTTPLGSINVRTATHKGQYGEKIQRNDDVPSDMVPVFPSKSALSILETFLNYGRKRDNGGKFNPNKDQIFIESGNVVMIRRNAAGVYDRTEISLSSIIVNGTIDKNNADVKKIIDYLSKKHMNVNSRMLLFSNNNNMFFLPKVKNNLVVGNRISIGDRHGIEMEFQNQNYKTWLSRNVLEVAKMPEAKPGEKLSRTSGQKNLIYSDELSDTFIVPKTKAKTTKAQPTVQQQQNVNSQVNTKKQPSSNTTKSSRAWSSLSADEKDDIKIKFMSSARAVGLPTQQLDIEVEKWYNENVYSAGAPKKFPASIKQDVERIIETQEAKDNLRDIFGDQFVQDHFEMISGLIHGEDIGYFTDDGKILLSTQSFAGVEYHEAFHRVWRIFVPAAQREEIITEFKTRANWKALVEAKQDEGYRTKSEAEIIEEILSDEFMDYMMNKKTKLKDKQRTWFQKLIDFLRNLFSPDKSYPTKVERLFAEISQGKYKNMSGSVDPIFLYKGAPKKAKMPVPDSVSGGYRLQDIVINDTVYQEFRNGFALSILRSLRDSGRLYATISGMSTDIEDVFKNKLVEIVDKLRNVKATEAIPMREYAESILDIYDKIDEIESIEDKSEAEKRQLVILRRLLNNNEIINGYKAFMKDLGIDNNDVTTSNLTIEEMLDTDNGPIKDDATYRVTFELDPRTSMKSLMRLLIATLPEVQLTIGTSRPGLPARKVYTPLGGTILSNIAQPANWNNTVSLLLKEMAGVPPIFVRTRLDTLGSKFPMLRELVTYLLHEDNTPVLNLFTSAFHNHNYEMSIQMMRIDKGKDVSVYSANANINSGIGTIQLRMRSYIEQQLTADNKSAIYDYFNKIPTIGSGSYNQDQLTKILGFLGIEIPPIFLEVGTDGKPMFMRSEFLVSSYDTTTGGTTPKDLSFLARTLVGEIIKHTSSYNSRINNLDGIFNGDVVKGTLNQLAEVVAKMTPSKSVSIMNGQNKMYYPINQHSYQTVMLDDISFVLQASTAEINEMYNMLFKQEEGSIIFDMFDKSIAATRTRELEIKIENRIRDDYRRYNIVPTPERTNRLKILYYTYPYIFMSNNNYNSVWKQQIIRYELGTELPIQIVIKDSLKLETDKNGQHLSDLYASDLFTVILSSTVYGEYKSVQHAERAIYYFYKTKDFIPYNIDMFNNKGNIDEMNPILSNKIINTVLGYLTDELLAYHSRTHEHTNYSGFGDKKKYNGLFNDIIQGNSSISRSINAFIEQLSSPNITHQGAQNLIREYLANNTVLRENIIAYVVNKSNEFVTKLQEEHGLLTSSTPVFNESALSIQDSNNSTSTIARIAWINTWITHIEETKLFSGPVQLYGSAGTFWKRMVTQSSTGNLLNNSPAILHNINTYNQETANTFGVVYGKEEKGLLSEIVFVEEKADAVAYRELVHEQMVSSYTQLFINAGYDQLDAQSLALQQADKYAAGYSSVNENDGIGWINPFAYRAYMIMAEKWTEEMQEVFDFEMYVYADALRNIYKHESAIRRALEQGLPIQNARNVAAAQDRYTPIDELFNRFMKDKGKKNVNSVEWFHKHAEAMTMLKPQYVGQVYSHKSNKNPSLADIMLDENIEHFIGGRKMAYDYLSPYVLRGEKPSERTKQFDMLRFMVFHGIDHMVMGSGAKFGTVDQVKWYNKEGQFNVDDLVDSKAGLNLNYVAHLDWRHLKNQVDIHTHQEAKVVDSSQSRKNKVATVMNNGVPIDFDRLIGETDEEYKDRWNEHRLNAERIAKRSRKPIETSSTLYNLKEEYKSIQAEITYRLITELESSIGFSRASGLYTEDLDKIISVLKQNAKNRNYSSNLIEMIEDIKNTKAYDFLPGRKRIESLLTSLVSRETISQKRLGIDLPQAPSTGLESISSPMRIAGDEGKLRFYRPNVAENTTSSEVIMPLPEAYMVQINRYYLNKFIKAGGKKEAFNIFKAVEMLNNDIADPNSGINIEMLGLRIPNQQLSSNDWMRAVKFYVPIKNSYVYVPHYIVVKVGSDFDIDKLKIYLPHLDDNLNPIEMDNDLPTPRDVVRYKDQTIFEGLEVKIDDNTSVYNALDNNDDLMNDLTVNILEIIDMLISNDINVVLEDGSNIENSELSVRLFDYKKLTIKDLSTIIDALDKVFIGHGFIDLSNETVSISLSQQEFNDLALLLDELSSLRDEAVEKTVIPADMAVLQQKLKSEVGDPLKWSSTEALHNRVLEIERDILLNHRNFASLVKPVSMELATQVAEEHGINEKVNVKNLSKAVDPLTNMENAIYFVHAKMGVGRVALTINIKAVSLDLDVSLNKEVFSASEDRIVKVRNLFSSNPDVTFSDLLDGTGTITLDNSSETLTLQVDAVKNPISVHLGMNLQTLNLIGYLINIGVSFPDVIGLFQTPVISDYLQSIKLRTSKYIGASNGFVSKANIKKEFYDEWLINKAKSLGPTQAKELYKFLAEITEDDDQQILSYKDVHKLREAMLKPGLGALDNRKGNELDKAKQELVMLLYMFDLIPTGDEFTDFLLAAAADTRVHKSLEAAERMQSSINSYLTQSFTTPKIVSANSFKSIMDKSIVGSFFESQREYTALIKPLYRMDKINIRVGNTEVPIFAELRELFRQMTPIGSTSQEIQRYEDSFIDDLIVYLTYRVLEDAINPTHPMGIQPSNFSKNILEVAKTFLSLKDASIDAKTLLDIIKRSGVNLGITNSKDPKNRILLEKKVTPQNKEVRVARIVDRTLPNVEIEDMISSISQRLNNASNIADMRAALSLFFVSTMQSGISNSPYSFSKVMPYTGAVKDILIKSMELVENLSDENKLNLAKEFFDWFLRANPYVNGNESRQRRNIKFFRLISPYHWSLKNGVFSLIDNNSRTNVTHTIIGSSFHKEFNTRGNAKLIDSLFNAYLSTKGIVIGSESTTIVPVINGIITSGVIGPSSAALIVARNHNIPISGYAHPEGKVAEKRMHRKKLENEGLEFSEEKFVEKNIEKSDGVVFITTDKNSSAHKILSGIATTSKKPYLLINMNTELGQNTNNLYDFFSTNNIKSPYFVGDETSDAEKYTVQLLNNFLNNLTECE